MHHQVLMGELDGFAHAPEEHEALRNGKTIVLAKSMDRNSIDVFHHKEGFTLGGHATIQQPGNQRMVEPGENLALKAESLSEKLSSQRQIDQLDGYLLLEIAVRAMSDVHGAHSAAPDEPVDFIGAHTLLLIAGIRLKSRLRETRAGKHLFLGARFQQRTHFRHHGGISVATRLDQRMPITYGQGQRLVEDCFDARQHFGRVAHRMTDLNAGRSGIDST